MVETLAELPFIGDQVVCLSHDQAARSLLTICGRPRIVRSGGSLRHRATTAAALGYALAVERLATGWRNLRDNFAVVRRSLHRQKAAFAAIYNVESYAHTVRERLGVAASLLFGHDAGPFLPLTAGYLSNVFFASVGSVRGATIQLASRPRSWLWDPAKLTAEERIQLRGILE